MESTSRTPSPQKEQKESPLKKIITGDIFVHEKMKKWYIYTFFLAILAVILLINNQKIIEKQDIIQQKEQTYELELSRLKMNNNFISDTSNQKLIKILEEQGFEKRNKQVYNIKISALGEEK